MTPPATPVAFWGRGWFWCLLALASLLPFIVAPLPMMPDYFSHTARYHVMNHGAESPFLPHYYHFQWALIGNLGIDLLMMPLGAILPTETAALVAVAAIPVLTIAGIYAVAIAAWGRIEAPALLALPFVYSFTFLYGFVNYHLAVALALLVFAAWIRLSPRGPLLRWLVFAPLAAAVWVAHIAGWAVLLLLVSCWELATALGPQPRWRDLPAKMVRTAVKVLPVALPLVLTLAWRGDHPGGGHPFILLKKTLWIFWLLRAESRFVDCAAVALLAFAGLWLWGQDGRRRDRRILLGAAVLFLCFVVMPQWVFDSNYADARLLPVFGIVFFLGLGAPARRASLVATLGLGLFGVRLAATSWGWHERGTNAVADLRVLDQVPQGARIAVLRSESICGPWVLSGLDHLASVAIIRREAFVNTQWDVAGAQLMRPIYNRGHRFNSSESGLVNSQSEDCGSPLATVLTQVPRSRFDFVWAIGSEPKVAWLVPVAAGPDGHLYRIIQPGVDDPSRRLFGSSGAGAGGRLLEPNKR